jgi:ATP/maltotriose-dependent transcriptional regulator MalT
MFFDKSYIERICSPDILTDESCNMTAEETISWIEGQGLRYEFEERAAILEYDGGLSRDEADAQALIDIRQRMEETAS